MGARSGADVLQAFHLSKIYYHSPCRKKHVKPERKKDEMGEGGLKAKRSRQLGQRKKPERLEFLEKGE